MKLFDIYRPCTRNAFLPSVGLRRLASVSRVAAMAANIPVQQASAADELPIVTFKAEPSNVAKGGYATLSWSSKYADKCQAYGPWSGSEGTSGSSTTNGLSETTTYVLTCFNPTGAKTSAKATVTVTSTAAVPAEGTVKRPSYNTGDGFFVYDGKIYDANGNEFRIRGVNRCHFDSDSQPSISRSKANTVRMFMYELSLGAEKYAQVLQSQHIAYHEVPIVSMPMFPDNTLTSGSQSTPPSLHRRYPTSAVLRTSPPPRRARPVPRGCPVDRRVRSRDRVSRVAPVFLLYTCRRHYPGGIVGCVHRSLPEP